MKIVLHPPVEPARLARICGVAETLQVINAATSEEALAQIVDADAFFGKLTPALLRAARQLQWVQAPTASLEHYVFPELVSHPCVLSNMRGLYSDVIADQVLGYVLCFARNFPRYFRQQMARKWSPAGGEGARSDFLSGPGTVSDMDRAHLHLADCTLGIVGVGEIGSEIARRAHAFGMRLLGVDPVKTSLPGFIPEIWRVERLTELLHQSDFVVIAAPHTPETSQLFRAPLFSEMKKSGYFINIGRGAIVNLADLTEALRTGTIAGAALDVFEFEPLPPDHPLWGFENVIITPHVAGASPRIAERHTATLLENIRRVVEGKPPTTLVDKSRWF